MIIQHALENYQSNYLACVGIIVVEFGGLDYDQNYANNGAKKQ